MNLFKRGAKNGKREDRSLYQELGPPSQGSHHYPASAAATPTVSTSPREETLASLRPPQPPFAGGKISTRIKALMKQSSAGLTSKRSRSRNPPPPGDGATSPGVARPKSQQAVGDSSALAPQRPKSQQAGEDSSAPVPPPHSSKSTSSAAPFYPGTLIPVPSINRPQSAQIQVDPPRLTLTGVEGADGDSSQGNHGPKPPGPDAESGQHTPHPPTQTEGCRISDQTQKTKSLREPIRVQRASFGHRGRVSASVLEAVAEEDIQEVSLPGGATPGDTVLEPGGHDSFHRPEDIGHAEVRDSLGATRSWDWAVIRGGSGPGLALSANSAGKQPQRGGDGQHALSSHGQAVDDPRPSSGNDRNFSMPSFYIHENISFGLSFPQRDTPLGSGRGLPPSEGESQRESKKASGETLEPKAFAETPPLGTGSPPDTARPDELPTQEELSENSSKPSSSKARPWASWFRQRQKEGHAYEDPVGFFARNTEDKLRKARAKEEMRSHDQNRVRRQFPLRE